MINFRLILFVLGILITVLGLFMLVPLLVEIIYYSSNKGNFFISFCLSSLVGISLVLAFKSKEKLLNIKDTLIITSISWPLLCIFASVPFYLDNNLNNFYNAFFEATSGLTTTGASVYINVENLSRGILMWRSLLQWLGGLGIIIFAIGILPILNIGGMQLFTQDWNEKPQDLHYRSKELSKLLGLIYFIFTLILVVLLWLGGLPFFDAICHAMTTIATGGFSTNNNSIGHYNNLFAELVIIGGMLLASLPFTLYISTAKGNMSIFKDNQVIAFFLIALISTIIISMWINYENNINIFTAFRLALFNCISLMTGTGYSTANFSDWGSFSSSILLILMLIGGCTGSTTGGLKIFRIQFLILIVLKELKKIRSPRTVFTLSYKRNIVDSELINPVMIIVILFFTGIFVVSGVFSLHGYDFLTSVSAAITSICVVGPGMGNIIGPENTFDSLPPTLKVTLSFAMIIGRLEFLSFMLLLIPNFWSSK